MKNKKEKNDKSFTDNLLYLTGQSLEIENMEEEEEIHEFSDRFIQRQKAIIEKVERGECRTEMREHTKRIPKKKWITFTAVAVLSVGLAATAGAAANFSLKNLLVDKDVNSVTEKEFTVENDIGETEAVTEQYTMNFLSYGLEGTNEYKASKEWSEYFEKNMLSNKELQAINEISQNGLPQEFQKYSSAYNVYHQETADKVDEISEKYGLKLLSEPEVTQSYEQLLINTGVNDFLLDKDKLKFLYARTFKEGNFNGDIEVILDENQPEYIMYVGGMSVNRVGVFGELALNMGDLSDYSEWEYTNSNEDALILMINNVTNHSYIFYKGTENFVYINMSEVQDVDVYMDDNGGYINTRTSEPAETPVALTSEQLQRLADMIDFSVF